MTPAAPVTRNLTTATSQPDDVGTAAARDSARIEYERRVPYDLAEVHARMRGEHHDAVLRAEQRGRERLRAHPAAAEGGRADPRIVERDRRALGLKAFEHSDRWGLAHVVHVGLVRDADREHLGAAHRLAAPRPG